MKPDLTMRLTEETARARMRVDSLRRSARDAFTDAQKYAASASVTGLGLSCRLTTLQTATEALVAAEAMLHALEGLSDD